ERKRAMEAEVDVGVVDVDVDVVGAVGRGARVFAREEEARVEVVGGEERDGHGQVRRSRSNHGPGSAPRATSTPHTTNAASNASDNGLDDCNANTAFKSATPIAPPSCLDKL